MNWKEYYKSRLTNPEEAIKKIKKGDYVSFAYGNEPLALGLALLSRGADIAGVKVFVPAPGRDFAWYDPGWEEIFNIEVAHVLPIVQAMVNERRGDFLVGSVSWAHQTGYRRAADVLLVQLSPPDNHGYCSFGASLWDKKQAVRESNIVIAEINQNLIRTYGDNFIHVSEIDYFVEHTPSGKIPGATDMLGRRVTGSNKEEQIICEYVASIIKDGDTLELGAGGPAEWVARLGVLDDKKALGWFSENTPQGIVDLVQKGVITGEKKTVHKGKVVATACGGSSKEDMDFINMNPLFELYSSDYILNPSNIAVNENMVAINSALMIDLTGQIAAESIGPRMIGSTGGQLAFAMGAHLSKGGHNITVMQSTAKAGSVSRIVSTLEPGTIVTVPRTLADIVVTEYGIAHLRGKTQRQRAEELISIAHPNFKEQLKKAAKELYYP